MTAASIISSIVTAGTNNHSTVSEEANATATDFITQGVVGTIGNTSGVAPSTGSFGVSQDATADMGVTVNLGIAYVSGTPSGQGAQVLRARMSTNYTGYIINANSSGSTKYDWIYLQLSPANAAVPSAAADNVITLYTSRSTSNTADNGTPPTYGVLLAVVTVANGASSITNAQIADKRVQASIGSNGAWTSYTPTVSANTGTFTTVSATGFYTKIGKTVNYRVDIVVTTAGTAAFPWFSLPVTSNYYQSDLIGTFREGGGTGKSGTVVLNTSTTAALFFYDNGGTVVNGYKYFCSGTYESV